MRPRIYMDHHATTPVDPRVLEAMLPYFTEKFGNPASRHHAYGWEAEEAVEKAREQVAALVGAADPKEIVFTSGATEANNLAIQGVAAAYRDRGNHVVTCATEHKAVLDPLKTLEKDGRARVSVVPVAPNGLLDVADVERAIAAETILVSVMHANNEIGVLAPVAEIGRLAKARGVLFHTDAAQSAGKVPLDVETMGIDLASLSAHKMYGPKGVGALYVRKRRPRVKLRPILEGGGHERGLRSGTLPAPLIVGFGIACEIAAAEMETEAKRLRGLRDRLWNGLSSRLDRIYANGDLAARLPGNLNVSFEFVEGESLLMGLNKDVAVSTASACTTATVEPSHVLNALGVREDLMHSSVRFGIGRTNTAEEIDATVDLVVRTVIRLRKLSPLYSEVKR